MKKEEMTEGRKAGWAGRIEPGPLLSSKSGSATDFDAYVPCQTEPAYIIL